MTLNCPSRVWQTGFFISQENPNSALGLSGRTLSSTIGRMLGEGFSRKPDTPIWKRLAALASEFGISGLREISPFADLRVPPAEPAVVGLRTAALFPDLGTVLRRIGFVVLQPSFSRQFQCRRYCTVDRIGVISSPQTKPGSARPQTPLLPMGYAWETHTSRSFPRMRFGLFKQVISFVRLWTVWNCSHIPV